jgi:hypothetical protein
MDVAFGLVPPVGSISLFCAFLPILCGMSCDALELLHARSFCWWFFANNPFGLFNLVVSLSAKPISSALVYLFTPLPRTHVAMFQRLRFKHFDDRCPIKV